MYSRSKSVTQEENFSIFDSQRDRKRASKSVDLSPKLIEGFQQQLHTIKAVSFDVFDTTLQRVVYPKEVFALVEVEAVKQFGRVLAGYADKRIWAEIKARKRKKKECGHSEISLEEIYEELRNTVPKWTNYISDLLRLEMIQEERCCRAHPLGHKLSQLARSAGKQIIFISDMYLGAERIKSLLLTRGYSDPNVFCSSDHGCNKSNTKLYNLVAAALGLQSKDILHIGDNAYSDYKQALNAGFRSLNFYEPAKPPEKAKHFPVVTETDNTSRVAEGIIRQEEVHCDNIQKANKISHLARTIGHSAIGPMTYGLCYWLYQQLVADKRDLILFLGRDGYLPHKILLDWQSKYGFLPETKLVYFPFSRRAAAVACAADGVTALVRETLGHHRRTVPLQDYFERIGLNIDDHMEAISTAGFSSHEDIVHRYEDRKRMERLITLLENTLKQMGKSEKKALLIALKEAGYERSSRPAIFDIGWRGTQQACLQTILSSGPELHGYYLSISDALPAAGTTSGYLVNKGLPRERRGLIESSTPIVEISYSSTEPYLLHYGQCAGEHQLVQEEENTNARAIAELHIGAEKFVASLTQFYDGPSAPLSVDAAINSFNRIALNPTNEELEFFQTLVFSDALSRENSQGLTIITPPKLRTYLFNYHKFVEAYSGTFWRANFIQKMSLPAKLWVWPRSPSFRRIWKAMRKWAFRYKNSKYKI